MSGIKLDFRILITGIIQYAEVIIIFLHRDFHDAGQGLSAVAVSCI
ncbi:hypothetical protein SDC9_183833 [bioreactor metagenome]|uniref:Uncharacterized protein n=1 Tax=bioreactor metagenome TaxID=1076179 RepID=A0A645HJL0_9ZZZZ